MDKDFIEKYKKYGLILKNCPICRFSFTMQHHWNRDALLLYCKNGCGSIEVKREGKMTAEDMIVKAVTRWNSGDWDK